MQSAVVSSSQITSQHGNNYSATASQQQLIAQPKPGDLIFKSNFEGGNLSQAHGVSDCEYDLYIRPDTNNNKYRLWFYFSVQNARKNQRVLFTICNFSKTRSLYRYGMSPIVRSTSRSRWERIPEKYCYYYRSLRHNKSYVLSFLFLFDVPEDEYFFAYCFPYSYTDLQKFLYFFEAQSLNYFKRECLCRTVHNRRLDLITITSPKKKAIERVVYITARVHPGETPASYVCHGLISFLLSDHLAAQILRDNLIFKIIPMLNPDGVFLGNYRSCSMGFDLNRQWLSPSVITHPTIFATRKYLLECLKNGKEQMPEFFIDIHSHSSANSSFMYMNYKNEAEEREDQMRFPKLLDIRAKEFSFSNSKTCRDPSKVATGRRALGEFLGVAHHCYGMEVSFYSYVDGTSKPTPFTQEAYMNLGKNLALTFMDFYGL